MDLTSGEITSLYQTTETESPDENFVNLNQAATLYVIGDTIYFLKYIQDIDNHTQYMEKDSELRELRESQTESAQEGLEPWEYIIYSMDKSGGNVKELYYSPWIEEFIIIGNSMYIYLDNFSECTQKLVRITLDDKNNSENEDALIKEGTCCDLQVVGDWLYYKNIIENETELERIDLKNADVQTVDEEETIATNGEFDGSSYDLDTEDSLAYELIGNWQALDEDAEPVALQFLSEDQVLIKSGIAWQEETFDEYHYSLIGTDQIVFQDEEGTSKTVFFELDTNAYGSDFLRVDYSDENEVLYECVEEIE